MSAEFERLVAQFERFQSKVKHIDDQFAGIGQMQEEVSALEASASSPGRSVTVVAGPGGSIKDIKLSTEALRQQPGSLSAEIMATLRQAVAEVARKQAGIVEAHMGGEMHLVDQVLESQAQAFGTSVEELRSEMPDAPTGSRPTTSYDDDSGRTSIADSGRRPYPSQPSTGGSSQGDAFLNNLFNTDDYEEGR